MKVSELKRQLVGIDCYCKREGANHEIWFSPVTEKQFSVPRHDSKEVPTGTLNSIKKAAGL